MGILLDIVPNHMGIGPENPFWTDVLRKGRASRFADWFDVSWRAATKRLEGKVLVPILGDTLDTVIARDELWVERTDDGAQVRYFDHAFPGRSRDASAGASRSTRTGARLEHRR